MNNTERILTSSEYYAYQPGLSNIPPTEQDFARWKEQEAALKGRTPIKVSSEETADVLNEVLGIGVTYEELAQIKDFLEAQKLFLSLRNPFADREREIFDIVGLLDVVRDIADFLRPAIRPAFLSGCIKALEIQLDARRNGFEPGRRAAAKFLKMLRPDYDRAVNHVEARTLKAYFKEGEFDRWLNALKDCELATEKPDGSWSLIYEKGKIGHTVRAIWHSATDIGLINKNMSTDKEVITNAIKCFFGMEKLSKDHLSKENPHAEHYKRLKNLLGNKLKVNKL